MRKVEAAVDEEEEKRVVKEKEGTGRGGGRCDDDKTMTGVQKGK